MYQINAAIAKPSSRFSMHLGHGSNFIVHPTSNGGPLCCEAAVGLGASPVILAAGKSVPSPYLGIA